MPPTALFVVTFIVWLAAKGRLADYAAFATAKAEGNGTPSVPSAAASGGSVVQGGNAPLLRTPSTLPPLTGSAISDTPLWDAISNAVTTGAQIH